MIEFQVIVLAAGKGSRITELTTRKPKCLLPIGNRPMVYYSLKKIEKSGFREVFLVVLETAKSEVEFELDKTDLVIKVNYITIPSDADWGTADSLRHLSSFIISDFIVVSCDLLTTVNIKSILNFYRKNDAALTALYFEPNADLDFPFTTPGPKSKNKPEKDLVGIDPSTNRLVFLASASDYEVELPLNRALLHKHGNIRIYTNLLDAHFFVMKKWLIKYLTYDQSLSTVKGELIPFVLKKQLSKDNKLSTSNDPPVELTPVKDQHDKVKIDPFSMAKDPDYDICARSKSSFNDHAGDLSPTYLNDNIRCYSYIVKDFGLRTNTVRDFCKANRLVSQYWNKLVGSELTNVSSEAIIESTQFEKETCFVGAGTTISGKTSIKSTSFGSGCLIRPKARISECIIMNNVQVKEGVVLTNCIICDGVIVEENCVLKDCLIGSQYTIPANSSHSNEVLTKIENLMEI